MPKFPGKKPSQRKASKKASTKRVREFLDDADDAKRVSRIKVGEKACDNVQQSDSSNLPEDFTPCPASTTSEFCSPDEDIEVPSHVFTSQSDQCSTLADRAPHSTVHYSTSVESPLLWPNLPPPPPLVRAPISPQNLQVAMPVMYAPTYWAGGHGSVQPVGGGQQGSPQPLQQLVPTPPALSGEDPFLLMFVKGNISRCGGCGNREALKESHMHHLMIFVCSIRNV